MTFEQIRDILVDTLACEAEQVTMEATLADDLGADSLAVVELTMALEEATGTTIADEDAVKLKTVADVLAFVNKG
ncbi:acyl carrier protein [Bengtsoniella intestinalis]|uniref:acyl carrier protein n=1 Tax=Bengtsoniella intestinalis TaxID=3073143 RepID=UPI00391F7AE3